MFPALTRAAQLAKSLAGRGAKGSYDLIGKAGRRIANNTQPWTREGLITQFAPDVLFGTLGGVMTPGDLGDKVIAGTAQAVGGGLGGVGLRGLTGAKSGAGIMMSEIVGGVGGDYAGMMVGDQVLRAKGGGMTPWEKMAIEERRLLEEQIIAEYIRKQGNPKLMTSDPTLVNTGLG
jgi:hypothetical protein